MISFSFILLFGFGHGSFNHIGHSKRFTAFLLFLLSFKRNEFLVKSNIKRRKKYISIFVYDDHLSCVLLCLRVRWRTTLIIVGVMELLPNNTRFGIYSILRRPTETFIVLEMGTHMIEKYVIIKVRQRNEET